MGLHGITPIQSTEQFGLKATIILERLSRQFSFRCGDSVNIIFVDGLVEKQSLKADRENTESTASQMLN